MKKFLTILFLLPLLVGCQQEDTLLSERDKIEKFLTGSRRMVPEENLGEVIENEPAFFSTFGRFAYRHIVNYYEAERSDKPVVEWGDKIDIRFNAFTIILGSTDIIEGLERTLLGCHEADSVQIFMTSSMAYGKNQIGLVPKESMLAWYIRIEKVTK